MSNPIYGALIYGAFPLLFLLAVPLLWRLLSLPIMFFLFPLLLAAFVHRLRRSKGKKVEGIERYNALVRPISHQGPGLRAGRLSLKTYYIWHWTRLLKYVSPIIILSTLFYLLFNDQIFDETISHDSSNIML